MKNFVQAGDTISLVAPYAVVSGDGVLVGNLFGVAVADAANAAAVEVVVVGVFDINALSTDTGSVGALMYWDNTNRRTTTTATANELIGVLTKAKASGEATARIRLNAAFT